MKGALVNGHLRSRVLEYLIKYEGREFRARELSQLLRIEFHLTCETLHQLCREGFAMIVEKQNFSYTFRAATEADPLPSKSRQYIG